MERGLLFSALPPTAANLRHPRGDRAGKLVIIQPDWRVNQSENVMAALTLVSMQGIINRSDPAVYLDWQDAGKLGNAAHFWLTPIAELC